MRISEGISMLRIPMNIPGTFIYPTLIWDNENTVLIDTGMPGMLNQIIEALNNENVTFDSLNKIIITHQDLDHVGSISEILKESPNKIEVIAHKEDAPLHSRG